MTDAERTAAYAELREPLAPVVEHAAERGRDARHRAAQPLRDLARQHRRPGADRARRAARAGARPGAGHLPPQHRGAVQRRRDPRWPARHLVHLQVCGSDRGAPAATRPTGRRWSRRWTTSGYAGPLNIESFTADNASIATAASIWRPLAPTQDDLARDGLAFLRSLNRLTSRGDPHGREDQLWESPSIGCAFMGKAHSNAWRNVGPSTPTSPDVRQQVLVARDPEATAQAWPPSTAGPRPRTDWRDGPRPRRRRHRRRLPPRPPARRGRDRGPRGRQARARREAAGQHRRRGREDGAGRRAGRPRARRGVRWWASTTAACPPSRWPATWSPPAGSATYVRCRSPTSRTGWPTPTPR